MKPFSDMKGRGIPVLLALVDGVEFELLSFADGSWGIKKGNKLIDVYEPGDNELCIIAFGNLIGLDHLKKVLVVQTSKAGGQFDCVPLSTSLN